MLYAIVAVIALIIDQAVKYWATANIVLNSGARPFIPGVLHLTNIHNTGAAFSILDGARWFFVILCLVFVALIVYVLITDIISAPAARWCAVIVMAGAVGNCIDRLICGYVVDMLEFEFIKGFPVFNVADIYITVGGLLFVIFTLLEKPSAKTVRAAGSAEGAGEKAVKAPAAGKKPGFELPFGKKKAPVAPSAERERPAAPAVDPVDPFAEWERRAGEIKAANESKAPVSMNYVKPEPPVAKPETPAQPQPEEQKAPPRPAVSYPSVSEETVTEKPAATEAPAAPAAPAVEDIDEFDFNIDDIMAEFKDL